MRILAAIVIIIGLATLVFGILFLPKASAAEQEIADEIAPVTTDQLDQKYDDVTAAYRQAMAAEGPAIAQHTAGPSVNYAYYAGQRALLGLARSNMGVASLVRMLGIVNIIAGLGLVMVGFVLYRKSSA